ncbi:OmpA family protein [Flavobacteriales bacterium]|nr:OmpA family protein [Flavobacteriales bacterium]MDB4051985.1 OmpA family protein [Flavobacteriales bacterium]MDC0015028.1 OmpA family protein [Flavobacteriales bacterium]
MVGSHSLTSLEYNDADYEASVADINPLPLTECNVEKGKELYIRFCTHCHGEKGAGDGKVSMNENINPPANAYTKPDGQMFYSITYGKGVMGAHGSLLNQKERWQVINYIKSMDEANVVLAQPCGEEAMPSESSSSSHDDFSADALVSNLTALVSEKESDVNHSFSHSLNLDHLIFATGSANLDMAKSQTTLDGLVKFMKVKNLNIEFDGYTDNTGDANANLSLSQARAEAVKAYLVANGIEAGKITAKGYGSENPKVSNDTPEGRAQNRRTEVKLK